jgi:hypothetical protein
MGRLKKNHDPIDDTFENVVEVLSKVKVENKRVKDKDKKNLDKNKDRKKSETKGKIKEGKQ